MAASKVGSAGIRIMPQTLHASIRGFGGSTLTVASAGNANNGTRPAVRLQPFASGRAGVVPEHRVITVAILRPTQVRWHRQSLRDLKCPLGRQATLPCLPAMFTWTPGRRSRRTHASDRIAAKFEAGLGGRPVAVGLAYNKKAPGCIDALIDSGMGGVRRESLTRSRLPG
jgi:hypothetical protein